MFTRLAIRIREQQSMCFSEVYVTFVIGRQVRLDVDALEYVETFTGTHIRTHGTHVSFVGIILILSD